MAHILQKERAVSPYMFPKRSKVQTQANTETHAVVPAKRYAGKPRGTFETHSTRDTAPMALHRIERRKFMLHPQPRE
ncbi:hypothetical protein ACLOJK_017710 [Asimina triloba]